LEIELKNMKPIEPEKVKKLIQIPDFNFESLYYTDTYLIIMDQTEYEELQKTRYDIEHPSSNEMSAYPACLSCGKAVNYEPSCENNTCVNKPYLYCDILCKEYGIPLLIFPRRKRYGEHSNDHQMEIAQALEERKDENIYVVREEDELEEKILGVLKGKKRYSPTENVGKKNLIRIIRAFIGKDL
jgi:hypothetical protein